MNHLVEYYPVHCAGILEYERQTENNNNAPLPDDVSLSNWLMKPMEYSAPTYVDDWIAEIASKL